MHKIEDFQHQGNGLGGRSSSGSSWGSAKVVGRTPSARPGTAAAAEPPASDSCMETHMPPAFPSFQPKTLSFQPKKRVLRPAQCMPCASGSKVAGAQQAQETTVEDDGGCCSRPSYNLPALPSTGGTQSNCSRLGQAAIGDSTSSKAAAGMADTHNCETDCNLDAPIPTPDPTPQKQRSWQAIKSEPQHGQSSSGCASDLITAFEQQEPKESQFVDVAVTNRWKAALQALADSDLQDVQKKVLLEVALASVSMVESHTASHVGQANGQWRNVLFLFACTIAVTASLASLLLSLWLTFILMEAGLIPV